jgi:hypothetical protein
VMRLLSTFLRIKAFDMDVEPMLDDLDQRITVLVVTRSIYGLGWI